jgi:ribosomal protein L37E
MVGLGNARATVEKRAREAHMYCPQCGGNNEDSIRYCTTCGLDLDKYRQQWQQPTGQQPPVYQQPVQQAPVYQQQYQPQYPAPPQYYQPAPAYGAVPRISSYMGWAIAVLILCFWPTGIVAVVYASQVGNRLALGDYAGAQESSHKAKVWCWVTFGIGIAAVVAVIIIWAIVAAAAITVY